MKIALLITGKVNTDADQYQNFYDNFIKDNDVDIFVSHSKDKAEKISKFCELYKPKCIIESSENYYDVSMYSKSNETNLHNMMCMFLNRKNVMHLLDAHIKATNTKYDVINSTRCDLWFDGRINFSDFVEEINHNKVAIPSYCDYGGVNDQFAFGNLDVMNKYLSVYDNISNLAKQGCIIHPETLLLYHLQALKVDRHRFTIKYAIKRY